jgi:hypothetical protein
MDQHNQELGGAAIGGILGFAKSMMLATSLSYDMLFDTAILAAVGAVAGYIATLGMKFLTKKIQTKWTKPKD